MEKNVILASTSTLYKSEFLEYLREPLSKLFESVDEIVFIPFARPSGISHEDYTAKVASFFKSLSIKVVGLHSFENKKAALKNAKAIFTGGGNTFLLVKTLYDFALMDVLAEVISNGTPYLGCSAGTNIGGLTMQTTNDMPIVYPPSFKTLGLVNFNINPHYLDPVVGLKHNGETRETRILEFLSQNETAVVGLREGSWLRISGEVIKLCGDKTARIFEQNMPPYELEAKSIIKL